MASDAQRETPVPREQSMGPLDPEADASRPPAPKAAARQWIDALPFLFILLLLFLSPLLCDLLR